MGHRNRGGGSIAIAISQSRSPPPQRSAVEASPSPTSPRPLLPLLRRHLHRSATVYHSRDGRRPGPPAAAALLLPQPRSPPAPCRAAQFHVVDSLSRNHDGAPRRRRGRRAAGPPHAPPSPPPCGEIDPSRSLPRVPPDVWPVGLTHAIAMDIFSPARSAQLDIPIG
uniref:Uncharacterized protein n=1 Tax=Oryza meridionalis TaxID=40149 RepID=A0A0E0BWH7_9ORYZ